MTVSQETEIALIRSDLDRVTLDVSEIKQHQAANFVELKTLIATEVADIKQTLVTQPEFWPVKTIVYGLVGVSLCGLLEAIIGIVLASKVFP